MLNSIDNAAKETLEEPKESAKSIRMKRKNETSSSDSLHETVDNEIEDKSKGAIEATAGSTASLTHLAGDEHDSAPPSDSGKAPISKDARQQLIKKNKEIERLNAECLDLEGQIEHLKGEVVEAWEAYKTAQEKAAAREEELQDEIKEIERAKSTDRQAVTSRLTELESTVAARDALIETLKGEVGTLRSRVTTLDNLQKEWSVREATLLEDLQEARLNSSQNMKGVREELRAAELSAETLRTEHAAWMRQAHRRQEELEKANSELTETIMQREREIMRLQNLSGTSEGDEELVREVEMYRRQVDTLSTELSDLKNEHDTTLRRLKQTQSELETSTRTWETERSKLIERCANATSAAASSPSPVKQRSSIASSEADSATETIAQLETQVRNLGQQLLKKQDAMQELLSERAGLKVRLQDAQRRCTRAEEQLASTLDEYSSLSLSQSSNSHDIEDGVRRRGHKPSGEKGKVITEFERIGVKAGPNVVRAVDMIDTWTLVTGR